MNNRHRILNLRKVYMIELIGPDYSDLNFKLKFWGETVGGKEQDVIVQFSAWGVEHLAEKLWDAQKKQERFVSDGRKALRGDE